MKNITRITILGLMAALLSFAQQNTVLQTSLSAAITNSQTSFAVASATGINAPSYTSGLAGSSLYIVDVGQTRGESVIVTSVSSTTIGVRRGQNGSKAMSHASGAVVLVATIPSWFVSTDPIGKCSITAGSVAGDVLGPFVTPVVNIANGNQWLCSAQTGTWVASWGNTSGSPQLLSGTATASVGGATAIAGPLVEISGTNAITSFTMSTGWNAQGFCVQPTGAFTGTASNNIAKAFTAVATRTLCFSWNARLGAFEPSY